MTAPSSLTPGHTPPDNAAALRRRVDALDHTLMDMMTRPGVEAASPVGVQIQGLWEHLRAECQAALPDSPLIATLGPKPHWPFEPDRPDEMLAKIRALNAALPSPTDARVWVADLRATGRTLLRLLRLPLWPAIGLNRRIRIDEKQPLWRGLIMVLEWLVPAALAYLIAWLRLRGGAP